MDEYFDEKIQSFLRIGFPELRNGLLGGSKLL